MNSSLLDRVAVIYQQSLVQLVDFCRHPIPQSEIRIPQFPRAPLRVAAKQTTEN